MLTWRLSAVMAGHAAGTVRGRIISGEHHMYIGPDTLMPVASALAAIAGVVLMFWRRTVGIVRMGAQAVGRSMSKLVGKR
jgi:hypothetical protein